MSLLCHFPDSQNLCLPESVPLTRHYFSPIPQGMVAGGKQHLIEKYVCETIFYHGTEAECETQFQDLGEYKRI